MSVTPVTSTTNNTQTSGTSSTSSSASSASLDYNTFLQLLLAQLKNQDPTQPMDSTAYMSQLASFSGVVQQVNTNSKLDSLITQQSLSQAENLIGKTASSSDGTLSGVVQSVTVTSTGSTANLDNGQSLPLGAGVTIS